MPRKDLLVESFCPFQQTAGRVHSFCRIYRDVLIVVVVVHVCLFCMVTQHIARVWINRERLQSCTYVVSWTGKINISLSAFAPENLVSRDRFGSPAPRQPARLDTQAESGGYFWLTGFLPSFAAASIYLLKPPYAIESVPSLSGHAIAYR